MTSLWLWSNSVKDITFFQVFFIVFQRFKNEAGLPLYFEKRLQVKPFSLKNTKLQNNKLFYIHHKEFARGVIR